MVDFNKTPMAHPDFRYFWWLDYTASLKKYARNLENELSDLFRFNRYGEYPDNDAAPANLIHNGLIALVNIAQEQTQKSKQNFEQYEKFCDYWVRGNGEWHGLQEFLAKEEHDISDCTSLREEANPNV